MNQNQFLDGRKMEMNLLGSENHHGILIPRILYSLFGKRLGVERNTDVPDILLWNDEGEGGELIQLLHPILDFLIGHRLVGECDRKIT